MWNAGFADPERAARKLIEIASTVEPVQDGRIHIEPINMPFLQAGGSADEYRAGLARASANGWLWQHESRRLCEVHGRRRRSFRLMAARGWKGWCQNAAIDRIGEDAHRIGSR